MSLLDLMEKRFSCRSYKAEPIKEDELNKILEAGRLAPTACNFQPERIYVVRNEALLEEMKRATRFTFDSKCILVVCYNEQESWHRGSDGKDHGEIDASIVATHMMLEAEELGIGCCYVCSFKEAILREVLNIPENIKPSCILPLGYKNEDKPHNSRKDLKDIIIYN